MVKYDSVKQSLFLRNEIDEHSSTITYKHNLNIARKKG